MKAGANSRISFLISYMHTDSIIDWRMPINHASSKMINSIEQEVNSKVKILILAYYEGIGKK